MEVIRDVVVWQQLRKKLDANAATSVGFVPTMGALHEGHASLLRKSVQDNQITVLSIFVNPTQFNNPKDLQTYPQTLEADLRLAEQIGVDFVLIPDASQMYADNYQYKVMETKDSQILEGVFRPGHFEGMLTVVLKLLNLVRPTRAYFGEKDFQQLELVRGMTKALFLSCEIVACATVREESGLAMSSRNARLHPDAKEKSSTIAKVLRAGLGSDVESVKSELEAKGFQVEYVADWKNRRLVAAQIDGVRLIDNVSLN